MRKTDIIPIISHLCSLSPFVDLWCDKGVTLLTHYYWHSHPKPSYPVDSSASVNIAYSKFKRTSIIREFMYCLLIIVPTNIVQWGDLCGTQICKKLLYYYYWLITIRFSPFWASRLMLKSIHINHGVRRFFDFCCTLVSCGLLVT